MNDLDRAKIEIVIARFDFVYVHELMKKMEWKWYTRDGIYVPDVMTMTSTARTLLEEAYSFKCCETGGFLAEYEDGTFRLKFIARESDSYFHEEDKKTSSKVKEGSLEEDLPRNNAISLLGE